MTDRFANIKLHDELIDWSRPDLSADYLSRVFIGSCRHWKLPDFEGMEPHEIEKEILLSAGRDYWHRTSPYGKPYYQHFLTLMKLLFPKTDITNTIADAVMFFCLALGDVKILNLIGCQNAGKSAGAIRIAFTAMFIDPTNTAAYVANPFDNAADSTVWGDALELWDELCEAWPHPDEKKRVGDTKAPSLFPDGRGFANKRIVFVPDIPKAGSIELRNVKHVGKYKGTKSRGKETDRGILFVLVDEINEIDNYAFLTTLENISSQDAFFGITSQNFKDEEDMGGQITSPVPKFGGPSEFADLELEKDLYWHSSKSSITLRFDGHRAPNILATTKGQAPIFVTDEESGEVCNLDKPRVLYSYLIKPKDLYRLREDGGDQSPGYYSQARSFPVRSGDQNTVLTRAVVSKSRHLDRHYTMVTTDLRVGFCDPAFGGRDAAVYGWTQAGLATVLDNDNQPVEQHLVEFKDRMKKLTLTKDATYDDYWFGRMRDAGIDVASFTKGGEVSYEDQVALQCREENLIHGISAANFGFDFSMRPGIVSSVNQIIGFEAVAFDYNIGALGDYMLKSVNKLTGDYCYDRVSELAFLAADLFLTKQVRGGEFIDTAMLQLMRTYYQTRSKKKQVEKKDEYKKRWAGRSPDERDTLMGLAGMLFMRGFRHDSLKSGASAGGAFSKIMARNIGKSKVIKMT